MISALNTAISGFNSATQRIAVGANNIANANNTVTYNNGEQINAPSLPEQTTGSSQAGGVASTDTPSASPASVEISDQNNSGVGASGLTKSPNEDQAQQLVNINIASYDAQANLSVIKVQQNLFQSTLNILS